MPIFIAPHNTELKVVKLLLDDVTKKHLENLGITVGSKLQVLSSESGSVILLVKNGRLALDRNIAMKILVA